MKHKVMTYKKVWGITPFNLNLRTNRRKETSSMSNLIFVLGIKPSVYFRGEVGYVLLYEQFSKFTVFQEVTPCS
jgi:hypothetical protein